MSRSTIILWALCTVVPLCQRCKADAATGTCAADETQTDRPLAGVSLLARLARRSAPLQLPVFKYPLEDQEYMPKCATPRLFYADRQASAKVHGVKDSAYQVVRISDAQSLGKKFARPAPYNDFIFTTNQGDNAFSRWWLGHLKEVGIQQQVLHLSLGSGGCTGLPPDNCVVHELGDILRLMGEKEIPPDDGGEIPGGALAVVSKWIWALAFAESGYNVLFADHDVAFIKNPLDYWWSNEASKYDIMALSDWTVNIRPHYCDDGIQPHDLNCQSTGLMFFRSNPKVIAVLTKMVKEASPPGRKWEQLLWQKFIPQFVNEHKGSFTLLPETSFLNLESIQPTTPTVAVAIHMGGIKGACTKMQSFTCLGLGIRGLEAEANAMCQTISA